MYILEESHWFYHLNLDCTKDVKIKLYIGEWEDSTKVHSFIKHEILIKKDILLLNNYVISSDNLLEEINVTTYDPMNKILINFEVRKHTEYGEALFIIGPLESLLSIEKLKEFHKNNDISKI